MSLLADDVGFDACSSAAVFENGLGRPAPDLLVAEVLVEELAEGVTAGPVAAAGRPPPMSLAASTSTIRGMAVDAWPGALCGPSGRPGRTCQLRDHATGGRR